MDQQTKNIFLMDTCAKQLTCLGLFLCGLVLCVCVAFILI